MSAVPAIKAALRDLLAHLYPDARVTYGPPQGLADQMVSVIGATVQHERPTSGGPTRSREEVADVRVILSVAAAGDEESWDSAAEKACTQVYAMFDQLEAAFRDRSVQTLGGACRDAIVSSHELSEYHSMNGSVITGRIAEIAATVTCRTRL